MRSLIAREEQPRNENVRLGGRGVRAGRAHGAISSWSPRRRLARWWL